MYLRVYVLHIYWFNREGVWLRLCTTGWRHHHNPAGASLPYVPRRAVLYCPGNDERKLRKLATLDVDCAVLDCEDGVALNKKVLIPNSPCFIVS